MMIMDLWRKSQSRFIDGKKFYFLFYIFKCKEPYSFNVHIGMIVQFICNLFGNED